MSQATMTDAPTRPPLNGVNTPALFATIDAVDGTRELAKFQFRATNKWQSGTHSRSSVTSFYGAGSEQEHVREYTVDADHPAVFAAEDNAPTPVELVLCGLASCITAGIGTVSAARGVELYSVESTIEGDIDLQGILGLSDDVRNGFQNIRIDFKVEGNASDEKLREIVEQSRSRSAVFDIVTNGVPVDITVNGS
jgi:uncharacterized OsmC-like protein